VVSASIVIDPRAKSEPAASRLVGLDVLVPLLYGRLRALARRHLRGEAVNPSLDPTALVHEAFLRLAALRRIDWHGRTHLLAMASREMRRILVERARAAGAAKRGGRPRRITLPEGAGVSPDRTVEILALDESLDRLAARSDRQARVVEMRVFGGLTSSEIGSQLGVSERTVRDDWRMARAWLARELAARVST
jgi:RNA polymerase sigma factor (TIGR02999 family)